MITEKRKDELIKICQELIRTQSLSGEEENVCEVLKGIFNKFKFDDYYIDEYGNIIGHIKGKKKGKKILFDAHIDTVPVPDDTKWKHAPFRGEIDDGKIYGRGASDMKGQLASMIAGASFFAEDFKHEFDGDIFVAGVVFEEMFEGVSARKISEALKPDYVVIGESSELNLKIGQRGRAEIVLETFGKSAHSANPNEGVNAVLKMMKLISEIEKIENPRHEILGEGILVLTDIKSSPYPGASVVPDYCKATFDRRLLVDETKEDVLEPIKAIIERVSKEDRDLEARVSYAKDKKVCYTGENISAERFFPAWIFKEEDEFVKIAFDGLKMAGIDPKISQYSFCTNGSHYAGEAKIQTIGFGPSKEKLAHIIDEYIEIDDLVKGALGYYGILRSVYKK